MGLRVSKEEFQTTLSEMPPLSGGQRRSQGGKRKRSAAEGVKPKRKEFQKERVTPSAEEARQGWKHIHWL